MLSLGNPVPSCISTAPNGFLDSEVHVVNGTLAHVLGFSNSDLLTIQVVNSFWV